MAIQTAKDFLLNVAVNSFNQQYGYKLIPSEFNIYKILPNDFSKCAFELKTIRTDDHLRLRIYIQLGDKSQIGKFQLETSISSVLSLNSVVYSADLYLDEQYLSMDDNYIRRMCPANINMEISGAFLLLEDGTPLLLADGTEFTLEDFTAAANP